MTDHEIVLFAVFGAIGCIGGIASGIAIAHWRKSLVLSMFLAPIITVGGLQLFWIAGSGLGALILLPGLTLTTGLPATISAVITYLITRQWLTNKRVAKQNVDHSATPEKLNLKGGESAQSKSGERVE